MSPSVGIEYKSSSLVTVPEVYTISFQPNKSFQNFCYSGWKLCKATEVRLLKTNVEAIEYGLTDHVLI